MKAPNFPAVAWRCAVVTSLALSCCLGAHAQSAPPAGSTEVPDGAPSVDPQATITERSTAAASVAAVGGRVQEERLQGRLASARVSVGPFAYRVVDPAVGQFDRRADNGGRRVTPSLWELLRF